MSSLIIERYIYDLLNARASIAEDVDEKSRQLALGIIRDIKIYFADHMDDVFAAHARLQSRTDADGIEMLAVTETTIVSFADADRAARAALAKASPG